jgi:Ras-related GTP-binding protein C/D
VAYLSPAMLKLERVHSQNSLRNQQREDGKPPDQPALPSTAKGKPRLLLMGQRRSARSVSDGTTCVLTASRSGKSSISSVVFHKLPPNETLYLESTARIQKDSLR